MLTNIIKTLPRDYRLVRNYIKTILQLRSIEKNDGSIGKVFDAHALKNPDKVAFYFKDEIWTFKQVYETSNKIGNLFAYSGLQKGDKVSLYMENRPEYICTWLGMCKIGVVTALVNFNLKSAPLRHSFDLVDSKAIICGYELAETFQDAYKNATPSVPIFGTGKGDRSVLKNGIDLDREIHNHASITPKEQENTKFWDELFYLFTSGTTGNPKSAAIVQARFLMAGVAGKIANRIQDDDIIYTTLPLYHTNAGIVGAAQTIVEGRSMVLREKFSASNFWKDCVKYNVTVAQYMGETMRYLLQQPPSKEDRTHSVRLFMGNGLRYEIWNEFVTRFNIQQIAEIYGSTEGNISCKNDEKPGACGFIPILLRKVFPITIVKLDENGEPIRDQKTGLLVQCKPGESGELVGRIDKKNPFRDFKGYASDKKANAKKVVFDVFRKGDSAFRTGDVFIKDECGYLFFKDRLGEAYRWKGENVSSTEMEYVISNLTPNKLDVVVFPVKVPNTDGSAGMMVIADQDKSLDIDALSKNINTSLPSYAIPLFLRIVNEIEKTGTYKMKKTDWQNLGYDVSTVGDTKLYFWSTESKKYFPLTKTLYDNIISGKIKL